VNGTVSDAELRNAVPQSNFFYAARHSAELSEYRHRKGGDCIVDMQAAGRLPSVRSGL
jgi:hypothetical protein